MQRLWRGWHQQFGGGDQERREQTSSRWSGSHCCWEGGGAAPSSHQHGLKLAMARDPPALQQGLQGEVQEVPGQTGVQGPTDLRKALIPLKQSHLPLYISKSKHIHTTQSFSSESVVISRIWMKLLSAVFLSYLEQLMLSTFNLRLRMSFLLLLFYLPYYA